MMQCPIHGFAGTCIVSPRLLELRPDGTLPEIVTVEVGEYVTEHNFFRFSVSPEEAVTMPIADGCIPFDENACEIMEGLQDMCGFCFGAQRTGLESQVAQQLAATEE